jgi:protocatechuate 3,4-dioxygenase beta subunit
MKKSDYLLEPPTNLVSMPSDGLQPTPPDILGPFYLPNAPYKTTLCDNPTLILQGKVINLDGKAVASATIEVWQADAEGNYDNDPSSMKFRGMQLTDANGGYVVRTIIPGDYKISEPGTPDDFRCSHIHFMIHADSYKQLITQLYFPNDKYNATDHWFDPRRVIQPPDAKFDFILERK